MSLENFIKERLFYKIMFLFILLFVGNEVKSFEINKIKREVEARNFNNTVRAIFNSSSSGTGFIIGKKNNRCSILTANHVIEGNKLEEIEVLISPGKYISTDNIIRPFNDRDLAIIQFDCSNIDKKYTNLTILPFINEKLWEAISPKNVINLTGYGIASEMIKEPILRSVNGEMKSFISKPTDGYNMLYEINTITGMSGGPIYMFIRVEVQINDPSSQIKSFSYKENNFISQEDYSISENNTEAENIAYQRCLKDPLLFTKIMKKVYQRDLSKEEYKRKVLYHCNQVAKNVRYSCPKRITPENITSGILVGIHGRSERYQYGGKSGYGFGTFLGEEKIIQWFKKNANELGLAHKDSFAYLKCFEDSSNRLDKYHRIYATN